MLLLLFEIGDGRYAMSTERIVEVVPLVNTKRISRAPVYISGLMNYRGNPVPVIDLCALTIGEKAQRRISTRIIIVRYPHKENRDRLLGLIASDITETFKSSLKTPPASGVLMDKGLYLDRTANDTQGIVQWFDLKRIVPEQEVSVLFEE